MNHRQHRAISANVSLL
ncbi:Bgt-51155 [Blumeria graminis f. sp. tritici]|uniref:Bgt-51155 n=1 Tax=Blumeria graminis f. sp. tritici TaxID=62690 RepID=A0A9X9MIP2_BLUGR|nr:Bgt-51155 [Blumeria graminis f. sp. tritici]